jgi:RNA polymerase sigma-70 factor (ECF subfamily)
MERRKNEKLFLQFSVTFPKSPGFHVQIPKTTPTRLNALTDNALMLQVKAGDIARMGLLFERYHRELFGFLYHMSHDATASEDMVQTVFYRMLKYRHTFTGEGASGNGAFRTWMYHIARNVLADVVQREKGVVRYVGLDAYAERLADATTTDGGLQREQELALLQDALARLSPEYLEVLVLSRYQELKYEEIARLLNTTEGAVKVRVHRAMNELKTIYLNLEHER